VDEARRIRASGGNAIAYFAKAAGKKRGPATETVIFVVLFVVLLGVFVRAVRHKRQIWRLEIIGTDEMIIDNKITSFYV
jgi:hypothetical protein